MCVGDNNGSGYTCTTKPSGELVCVGNGSGGGGGGSGGGGAAGGFVSKITQWSSGAMTSAGHSIVSLIKDAVVWVISRILDLFALIVSAIPVPDFMSQYSLGNLLSLAGPDVGWFMVILRIPECFVVIGSGYAFRLLRKLLTLFQW